MANSYVQISRGSRGDDVKRLQEQLNKAGYQLDVDGSYGPKTQEAVRQYQQKNGLKVDGVAGNQTWGKLMGVDAGQFGAQRPLNGVSQGTQEALDKYSQGYQPSDDIRAAFDKLQQMQGSKPGEYQSRYDDQLKAIYDKIVNREPFSFDLDGNALYQQYKDQYQNLGKTAMMDTMGQAAGLTGGYGSSYGQSVGQQTYNAYLQKLNDVVPELYGQAYDQYRQQGQDLLSQYGLVQDAESRDYGRYQDGYNRWLAEMQNAQSRYDSDRGFDYNQWRDMLNYYQNQAAQEQDQANWQAGMDFEREQYEYQKAQAAAARRGSGGGKGKSPSKVPASVLENLEALHGDDDAIMRFLRGQLSGNVITEDQMYQLFDIYSKTEKQDKTPGEGGGGSSSSGGSRSSGSGDHPLRRPWEKPINKVHF